MDELMGKLGGAEVLRKAVSGMLPKNRLRDDRLVSCYSFSWLWNESWLCGGR